VFSSFPESIDVFEFALEKDPKDSHAQLISATSTPALAHGRRGAVWEEAVKLDPTLSVGFRNLAMHAWKTERFAKANELLAKAIQARPDDEILYRDRAQVLIALGKRPDAIDLLAKRPRATGRGPTPRSCWPERISTRNATTSLNLSKARNSRTGGPDGLWDLFNHGHVERGKLRFEQDYEAALADFRRR